ncbi:hypothetical protein LTR64_005033 [Lithohypha guttulata]|uniref:uncharacterized protein n=1 Tax=Lithohypha guttulata TaxID=1690604 RepID=UPI002DE15A1D|nr:hypothetical protein LTR51_005132 [Lithohypha guttulata]
MLHWPPSNGDKDVPCASIHTNFDNRTLKELRKIFPGFSDSFAFDLVPKRYPLYENGQRNDIVSIYKNEPAFPEYLRYAKVTIESLERKDDTPAVLVALGAPVKHYIQNTFGNVVFIPHPERLRRWSPQSEVDVVAERLKQAKQDFLVDIDIDAFRSIYNRTRNSEPLRKKLKQSDDDNIAIIGLEDEPPFAFDSALAMANYGGNDDDVSQWRNENWYMSFILTVQSDSWSSEEYLRSIRNDFWSIPKNRQALSERSKAWHAIAANKAYHSERVKAAHAELKADLERYGALKAKRKETANTLEALERSSQHATAMWARPDWKETQLATNKAFSTEYRKEYYQTHPEAVEHRSIVQKKKWENPEFRAHMTGPSGAISQGAKRRAVEQKAETAQKVRANYDANPKPEHFQRAGFECPGRGVVKRPGGAGGLEGLDTICGKRYGNKGKVREHFEAIHSAEITAEEKQSMDDSRGRGVPRPLAKRLREHVIKRDERTQGEVDEIMALFED